MSHQDQTEADKPHQSDSTMEHELSASVKSISFQNQPSSPPSAFKLDIDGWEEVFDWLSLTDLHAFGQTCKTFHQVTGKYFEWKYKRVLSHVYGDSMSIDWKDLDGFQEFAQRLAFYDSEPDTSLLYALKNCKSPKEMEIVNARATTLDANHLEKMLANLEILKICNIHLSNEFFESFAKLCVNLKRLKVVESPGSGWMCHKYPKLEHLQLHECKPSEDNDLVLFFIKNPNVRAFTTTAAILLRSAEALIAKKIQFDDLTIIRFDDIDIISNSLIDFHQRGFYKHLHFVTKTAKHLANLPALTTLYVETDDYIKMPPLTTVTELIFRARWNGLCSWMDMDEVSMALTNLERVFSCEISVEYMLPFIRNSARLKEIKMEFFRDDCGYIDPVHMNVERRKLKGARKLSIFVRDKDYLKIKWKHNKTDFGLIEIKRKESYDGAWERVFDR